MNTKIMTQEPGAFVAISRCFLIRYEGRPRITLNSLSNYYGTSF